MEKIIGKMTPTPWILMPDWSDGKMIYLGISGAEQVGCHYSICQVPDKGIDDTDEANMEFIVRAVNSHEALLQALKIVVAGYRADPGADFDWNEWYSKAEKAIAQAEGRKS